jgi:hypothetical protein
MIMDGSMDEDAWQQAEAANKFFMVLPMDTSLAQVKTDVRVTYDDHYFYLLAVCYKDGGRNMVESLRRDFSFLKNDNFLVFIDPLKTRQQAILLAPMQRARNGMVRCMPVVL